jgi:hypothetical protein
MAQALFPIAGDTWPWPAPLASAADGSHMLPGMKWFSDSLHLPFDLMRNQYAEAVHAGFLANSMLASRDFENAVDALEHMTLGPFARGV